MVRILVLLGHRLRRQQSPLSLRALLAAFAVVLVTACGMPDGDGDNGGNGSSGQDNPGNELPEAPEGMTTLAGVVIDGPVFGATVVILDADGEELVTELSDNRARFVAFVPEDARYPLTLTATGGTNLTTEADPGFALESVVAGPEQQRVVLSVLSTLALKRAECAVVDAGDAPETRVQRLLDDPAPLAFLERYDFGLDGSVTADLLTAHPQDAHAAAGLLLASEALAEGLRRAAAALTDAGTAVSIAELLWALACDLGDDGTDVAAAGTEDPQIGAFQTALAAVLMELALGELMIASRNTDSVAALEQAVALTFGYTDGPKVADMPLPDGFIDTLLRSVHASLALAPSEALFDLYAELFALTQDTPRASLRERLDPDALRTTLNPLLIEVAADPALAQSMVAYNAMALDSALPPQLSLSASPQSLATRGMESTTLSHTSEHATVCQRVDNGVWSGIAATADELLVGPIEQIESFTLRCAGPGGLVEQSLDVLVPPDVRIQFRREDGTVATILNIGETVSVHFELLDVTSEQCDFRRSDTGAPLSNGDTLTAEASLSITANCEGAGGTYVNSAPVPVGSIDLELQWTQPTRREDGEQLTNLIGYRIYHGSASGVYDGGFVAVDDPEQLTGTITVTPGYRYVAVTAVTADGLESRFSNEGFTHVR